MFNFNCEYVISVEINKGKSSKCTISIKIIILSTNLQWILYILKAHNINFNY